MKTVSDIFDADQRFAIANLCHDVIEEMASRGAFSDDLAVISVSEAMAARDIAFRRLEGRHPHRKDD